jgi:hypothetical protein
LVSRLYCVVFIYGGTHLFNRQAPGGEMKEAIRECKTDALENFIKGEKDEVAYVISEISNIFKSGNRQALMLLDMALEVDSAEYDTNELTKHILALDKKIGSVPGLQVYFVNLKIAKDELDNRKE